MGVNRVFLRTLAAIALGGTAIAAHGADAPAGEPSGPRAAVDQPVHDFGVIAPQEVTDHVFKLRNTGDAFLTIDRVVASCSCVLPDDVDEGIAPGGTADLRVSFKGKPTDDRYVQTVKVYTNDPTKPMIELRIVGRIAPDIVIDPPAVTFSNVKRGSPVRGRIDVVSGAWSGFEVRVSDEHHDALRVETEPLSAASLQARGATSGWTLWVEAGPPLTEHAFNEPVYFTVTPDDKTVAPKTLKALAIGTLGALYTIHGVGIDEFSRMKLGVIDPAKGTTRKFVLKVRDGAIDARLKSFRAVPDYVQVTVEPYAEAASDRVHRITVTVPPGRLDRGYSGPNAGELRLEFEDPAIGRIDLALEMLPAAPR